MLGKWLFARQSVYIFDEPTRGIDVNAKAEFYKQMTALTHAGNCIIMGGWQYLSPLQDKKLKAFVYAGRSEIFEKSGARLVFKKDTGLSYERADGYLRAVYGRGIKLEKELPGGLDIYIIE